jgi:hypothetical protein
MLGIVDGQYLSLEKVEEELMHGKDSLTNTQNSKLRVAVDLVRWQIDREVARLED